MPESGSSPSHQGAAGERARLLEAVLDLVGERGYSGVTLADLRAATGLDRRRFHAHFADLGECFAAAHAAAVAPLEEALAVATTQPDLALALRAILGVLADFIEARPRVARAVLREVYVAGGPALAAHDEVWERLSDALAGVCRETRKPRHSPPPVSASFMVGAIEELVRISLADARPGADLRTMAPELVRVLLGAAPASGQR